MIVKEMKKGTNDIFTFSVILFEIKNQISYNLKVSSPLQNRDGEVSQTSLGIVLCAPYIHVTHLSLPNVKVASPLWASVSLSVEMEVVSASEDCAENWPRCCMWSAVPVMRCRHD